MPEAIALMLTHPFDYCQMTGRSEVICEDNGIRIQSALEGLSFTVKL